MATSNTTQPSNQPIPQYAGTAPVGMVPTYGAAGIFTGYAPAPQGTQTVNVGGKPTTLPPTPNPTPVTPQQTGNQPTPQPATPAPQTPSPQGSGTPAPHPTQGQFYYTQSKDAQGRPVTTYYDANGNVLPTNPIGGDQYKDNPSGTPNAGGNLVQLPSAPTQGGFTQNPQTPEQLNTQIQGQAQVNQQKLDELNSQSDQAYADYESKITQLENGTYPLTSAQQSLLDSTKQQFDVLRQQQVIANTALTQGVEVAEARSGETEGGAQTALGNVGAAINTGIQKLSALDAQAGEALATLQQGFNKDDLGLIQAGYQAFEDHQAAKEKVLNDIYTTSVAAEKDLRDFTYKTTQDNITNLLNSQKESWTEKYQTMQNQLQQSQLDQKTKDDIQKNAIAQEVANNGRYEVVTNPVDGTQSIFDKETGQVVGAPIGSVQNGQLTGSTSTGQPISIGNTGIPILDANSKVSVSGVPFIDGTNLTGKQATAAQEDAARLGIPYLGKAQATAVANADTARINMQNISSSLQGLLASNDVTRLTVGPLNLVAQAFQSNDQLASFNAFRSAAIEALRTMAGSGGLRINQAEILQSVNQDIPKITDTVGAAQAKIAKVLSMIDSQERGMFGPQYDVMKSQSTENPLQSFYSASPQDAQVITKIKTQFPNYSDDEVMQVVRGLGVNLYSSMGIQYNQ